MAERYLTYVQSDTGCSIIGVEDEKRTELAWSIFGVGETHGEVFIESLDWASLELMCRRIGDFFGVPFREPEPQDVED